MQQAVALFVLKSGAGFSIFKWIAILTSDFLSQSAAGAEFFFDAETVAEHWFFVSIVCVAHFISQISAAHTCDTNVSACGHHFLHCFHTDVILYVPALSYCPKSCH
jgi:hypothetical protein